MMRRLLSIFSVNDPGWGNSPRPNDNKGDAAGSKDGNAGNEGAPPAEEQGASANPPTNKPEPDRKPVGNGPPDLDELWRDFNDRLSNLFGGKKAPAGPVVAGMVSPIQTRTRTMTEAALRAAAHVRRYFQGDCRFHQKMVYWLPLVVSFLSGLQPAFS